ncbi:MAG: VacB/RNase II family 3'-5' exoribonuclease [Candidatus Deferrimicrobiaceae bacterium]
MRDRSFWETWLRQNADGLRNRMSSIRDWYRAAGVAKGERRGFRAALKSLGEGRGRKIGGKFPRIPARGKAVGSRDMRGGEGGKGRREVQQEGRLRMTREGRSIVVTDSPGEPAIRIPGGALSGALPKDRVLVRLEKHRGRAPSYGKIIRIVERGMREFVGRYAAAGNRPLIRLRDREADLLLPAEVPDGLDPAPGELVLAEIAEYPSAGKEGRARIVRLLGESHTMDTLALAVTSARGLPATFSEDALEEASRIPPSVRYAGGKKKGSEADRLPRVDQRGMPFITIDGEDARDFDDAVCLVRERGRNRLLVAIADVSHYVPAGGHIDRDAYERGTSVYYPDRCIPMLPPSLSEGVCSLKAGVNRLTVTVDIPFNEKGKPKPASFYLSVIRSRARLTYEDVHTFLARQGAGRGREKIRGEIGEMLRRMETVAGQLTLARIGRGALDFDLPETKIFVRGGLPRQVAAVPRWESHRLIEEFMLLANTAVAEFLSSRDMPFLFRIHEQPAEDRMEDFEEAAARILMNVPATKGRDISSRLQAWAAAARGGKYERHINMLLLRSLMLARYGPEAVGHFGLALSLYTHFTSPIRRYPDLVLHRILKATLGDREYAPYVKSVSASGKEMGAHLSGRERKAMEAERDVEQRAKALYLSSRAGETFTGFITSLTGYGFYVELDDCLVEGFVPISTLRDDEYRYSADRGEWQGIVRKRRLSPGDRLVVRLRRADVDRGEIDFLFVEKLPDSL